MTQCVDILDPLVVLDEKLGDHQSQQVQDFMARHEIFLVKRFSLHHAGGWTDPLIGGEHIEGT